MNAILFVTSLITILALLTYAKIDTFRNFLGMEAKFENYMQTLEHSYSNQVSKTWYAQTKAKTVKNGKTYTRPSGTSPRLSFKIFIDSDLRSKDPELYTHTLQWTKSLMTILYGHTSFFQESLKNNAHFMDEILEGIGKAVEQLSPEQRKKITRTEDLSNLDLGPQLGPTYYFMLKGCQREEPKKETRATLSEPKMVIDDTEPDDEDDNAQEAAEYKGTEGYDSLFHYITLQNTTKIRVYLASKALLQVMTGQEAIANQIIEIRNSLYRSLKNDKTPNEEATKQFQMMVQGYFTGDSEKYLDFTVSKTNPVGYN